MILDEIAQQPSHYSLHLNKIEVTPICHKLFHNLYFIHDLFLLFIFRYVDSERTVSNNRQEEKYV